MTEAHHTRTHAVWSASATARNCVCPGAIAMSSLCEDVEREAAAWGTCAHQISERCLRGQLENASDAIGQTEVSGKYEFVVDEEMANCAQVYVDYVRERAAGHPFWIEQRFSLAALDPPLEAGGTGDAVIYNADEKMLEIVDLKGGRGVTVDVVGNPQGRSYAIGAMLVFPELDIQKIRVTIVQPRVGNGQPKSDEFHVADLMDWTVDLLQHMARAKAALDEFETLGDNRIKFDEWAERWLTPGQCTFCTAKPICPALRKKALAAMPDLAREWHEDATLITPPALSNLAKIGSAEELAHDLDGFDELEGWIKARRAYAHTLAEQGTEIPGYGLVDKIGNRAWKEGVKSGDLFEKLGLDGAVTFTEPQLKSVAQIEKVLGKRKSELAKLEGVLWEKPVKGTNLVRLDKTTRPAAKNTAERHHEEVEK